VSDRPGFAYLMPRLARARWSLALAEWDIFARQKWDIYNRR
jgi:hypothetical protein